MTLPVYDNGPVEIVQHEKTAEAEAAPVKGPWHPGVKIIVVPGRRVISYHGRAVFIIVVLDIPVRERTGRRGRSGIVLSSRCKYREAHIGADIPENVDGAVPGKGKPSRIRRLFGRAHEFGCDVRCYRVIGNPAVSRSDTGRNQAALRLGLIARVVQVERFCKLHGEIAFTHQRLFHRGRRSRLVFGPQFCRRHENQADNGKQCKQLSHVNRSFLLHLAMKI